jgi:exodeoxyribonuclease VII large subunit
MEEHIWKVSEVNTAVRTILENSLMPFWLRGEVGNLSIQNSGHVYLTLKDPSAQIRAVFFNGAKTAAAIKLQVGTEVEVYGRLSVYEARGEYQFNVKSMRPVGFGELQRRFEELKSKLHDEGLFAPERKKPIPLLPTRIGVVTSPDGAAIRDFLQIINRRFPNTYIQIFPSLVQGRGAENKLAAGIAFFNRCAEVDVIVITRGGGSIEDLWPFNEEILARAIAASRIPVISAVGHEIDFTICDFVADLRVPTPSAAAELVIGQRNEIEQRLERAVKDISAILNITLEQMRHRLQVAEQSYAFREPATILRQKQQHLDELERSMNAAAERQMLLAKNKLALLKNSMQFGAIAAKFQDKRNQFMQTAAALTRAVKLNNERAGQQILNLEGRLAAMSPEKVLQRGYAILTESATGKIITQPGLPAAARVKAMVAGGSINLVVE